MLIFDDLVCSLVFLGVFRLSNNALKRITFSTRIQLLGKSIRQVKTKAKVVALTYDDGPNPPYTTWLLDVLEQHQVKATFFVIGKQVEQYPETVKLMLDRGHELGNHSYSHTKMVGKSLEFIRSEIQKTDLLLYELGIEGNIHFRPPFGIKFIALPYVLLRLGKSTILWNVDSEDYKLLESQVIVNNVLDRVKPGSIILLHDALDDLGGDRSRTIIATGMIIKNLKKSGYQFKTVSELLALRN